jgi:hypothetical protein
MDAWVRPESFVKHGFEHSKYPSTYINLTVVAGKNVIYLLVDSFPCYPYVVDSRHSAILYEIFLLECTAQVQYIYLVTLFQIGDTVDTQRLQF